MMTIPYEQEREAELSARKSSLIERNIVLEDEIQNNNRELTAIRIELATRRIEERKQEAGQIGEGVQS